MAHPWYGFRTDRGMTLTLSLDANHPKGAIPTLVHDLAIAAAFIFIVIAPVLATLRGLSDQKDSY